MSMLPHAATSFRCASEAITATSITIGHAWPGRVVAGTVPTADGQGQAHEALIAAREVGGAGGAAEEKEQEVRGRQVGTVAEHGGHDRVSRGGGERTVVAGQAEAPGDAEQMGIDRQRIGGLRGEDQHAGRGLVADPGRLVRYSIACAVGA